MVLFGMRIKQLVGFPAFFGLFLIVFSAYVVDNMSGFVAMHGTFVLFGMTIYWIVIPSIHVH